MKSFPMLRNRMLADPSFLFKIGTEVYKSNLLESFVKSFSMDKS